MHRRCSRLIIFSHEIVQLNFDFNFNFNFKITTKSALKLHHSPILSSRRSLSNLIDFNAFRSDTDSTPNNHTNPYEFQHHPQNQQSGYLKFPQNDDECALRVQNLLKSYSNCSDEELHRALDQFELFLDEGLVLNVLKRHRSDWKPALRFFNWVSRGVNRNGYLPGAAVYNEMLGILGKMKRFVNVYQLFDEMSQRDGLMKERAYGIVVHRLAAAHKIDEAIEMFYKRKQYGLRLDLIAFQTLLLALCRYRHVEAAEFLFHSKKSEFKYDIKTWNIILNGWCVLGRLREAKRFWNEIIRSKIDPDKFTYGIFINSLIKSGKMSNVVKLFHSMWVKGCTPDIAICNSVIDGLCLNDKIPEALEIFGEMNDRDCEPDVATYNTLIKHLCGSRDMEKVYELLEEMERKKGSCAPNAKTYCYLLKTMENPEAIRGIVERMKRTGCKMTGDVYNLLLKMYMEWDSEEKVKLTWVEMEREGVGPDQRSYTVMIHGFYRMGKIKVALGYFEEMRSKGMVPEPMTKVLVDAINIELKNRGG